WWELPLLETLPHAKKSVSALDNRQMPSRLGAERKGITVTVSLGKMSRLLPVVHRNILELLALRIGPARCDCAGFAVGRHDNLAAERNLSAFLCGQMQRVVINLLQRPCV